MTPLLVLLVLGPKTISIVGEWVPSPGQKRLQTETKGLWMTFDKDGTMRLKSPTVTANGTYTVRGNAVTVTLLKRNGVVPKAASERTNVLHVYEHGVLIFAPTVERRCGGPLTNACRPTSARPRMSPPFVHTRHVLAVLDVAGEGGHVHQNGGPLDGLAHQVDEIGAAAEVFGAVARAEGQGRLGVGRPLVEKRSHQAASRLPACAAASP